jgi:hypothetical protein
MIDELDEVLRQLLTRELPIKNGEVDIAFNQPKREWSARVSRPTLNLYLYDLRENTKLRQHNPAFEIERTPAGVAVQRRQPIRVDLFYMVTAWAAEPEDEHRLLSRAVMALGRYGTIPSDLLPESFADQPSSIPITVAQHEVLEKPTDLWGVMDNEMRPAIGCQLTIALNPFVPVETPLVRTAEIRFGQSQEPPTGLLTAADGDGRFLWIAGQVRAKGKKPLVNVRMTLVERGVEVPIQDEGRFIIGVLPSGTYTVEVTAEGRKPSRYTLTVPSNAYDIDV